MDLTPDQRMAAKALGCAFFPATEAQVQRLTMQRRIFRLDGKPVLVSRNGAYYETHATLLALIEGYRPVGMTVLAMGLPPATQGDDAPVSEAARGKRVPGDAAGPIQSDSAKVAPSRDAAVSLEPHIAPMPLEAMPQNSAPVEKAPLTRVAARRRPKPSPSETPAPETSSELAVVKPEITPAGRPRSIRRSFGHEPPAPRWVTAGKARRGRLK